MAYRVIYDVREADLLQKFDVLILTIGFVAQPMLLFLDAAKGGSPWAWWGWQVVAVVLFAALASWYCYLRIREQRRCRELLRSGDYHITKGVVTDLDPVVRPNKILDKVRYRLVITETWGISFEAMPPSRVGTGFGVLRFRIAEVPFTAKLFSLRGGYRTEFTALGVSRDTLYNGVQARIAHHEGRILRIEVAV